MSWLPRACQRVIDMDDVDFDTRTAALVLIHHLFRANVKPRRIVRCADRSIALWIGALRIECDVNTIKEDEFGLTSPGHTPKHTTQTLLEVIQIAKKESS